MLPFVLVLEDSYDRIFTLRRVLAGQARVVWTRGVRAFQKVFPVVRNRLALIILDHDLGLTRVLPCPAQGMYYYGDHIEYGPRGLDGGDAASWLGMQGVDVPCPVLVWSLNTPAAEGMVSDLANGGVDHARIPMILPHVWPFVKGIVEQWVPIA